MTRAEAARNATRVRLAKREQALAYRREILALRSQIGEELARGTASGINVNLGDIDEEYVPELKQIKGRMSIYDRMVNDPIVRGQLTAITMTLISGVRWKVEGGTSEMQDLVAANLLRQGPKKFWCSTSWNDRLFETLGCLVYGFALFAKTRWQVEDKTIFSELKWLHPKSVDERGWDTDEFDNLRNVLRTFRDSQGGMHYREPIPADDIFLVPWDRRGPNWEGNSFIRPMYRPWKERDLAAKIDLIDLQNRGVGIPMAKLAAAGGVKERDTLTTILKDLRGGSKERQFVVIDKDEDVSFLTTSGNVREAATIMDRSAADSARVGMGQYLEAGNTQSGSRAASSSMATGFFIHVDAIKIRLEDIINFGAGRMPGLVEELIDMNFENVDEYPRIVGSRPSPTEQLDNVPLIGDLVQKGAIPRNLSTANELLERLGYKTLTKAEFDESVGGRSVVDTGTPSGQPEAGASGGNGGAGRPNTAGPDTQGRDDTMSRRFAGQAAGEKKTPDGSRATRSVASWGWLKSTPD